MEWCTIVLFYSLWFKEARSILRVAPILAAIIAFIIEIRLYRLVDILMFLLTLFVKVHEGVPLAKQFC